MAFLDLVKSRFSVRSFKDQPIEEEKLQTILEAGRLVPSAHNNQPQRIYIARSEEARKKLESVCPCTFHAPLILVVCYDRDRERKSKMNPGFAFGEIDATIACTQMMLEAADLGIGCCWVGMFNKQALAEALALPEQIVPSAMLTMGYPAEDAKPLPLHYQKRELSDIAEEL